MAVTPCAPMSEAMSTVLRLEREIQLENARALSALHQQYQTLSEVVLANARERGYLSNDPFGAVATLAAPPPLAREVGQAVIDLWRTFFSCFRDDEKAFEAARFREKTANVEEWLARQQPGDAVDFRLAIDLLQALQLLWQERHQAISERLDSLIQDLSTHQAQLGSAQLATAHTSDEMERIQKVVHAALTEANEPPAPGETPALQIVRLLRRYRANLESNRRLAGDSVAGMNALITAIRAIATKEEPPTLTGPAQAVVDEVRRLDNARRELEAIVRELRGHIIGLEGQRRELMEEVAERDRRLSRLDHADAGVAVDERLALYRQAFAALEAGGDYASVLNQARTLERVISLPTAEIEHLVKLVDRQLAELARVLEDLRKVHPLIDDPRRLRPRFFGSKYDFKAPAGLVQALRDASRDLLIFVERARWAAGVAVLARQVPRLRAVFKELVKLVAAWREKLGDPPPVSITISIDAGSGVLALPAILAADLDAILKRKTRAGAACTDLAPLLEDGVALYHKTLLEAKGDAQPRTSPAKSAAKRESPVHQVMRLSTELTALAGACETAFGEAAQSDFRLSDADAALMLDEHLMRLGLSHLDGAVGELAALPNAPAVTFTPAPGRRDASKLILCARERAEWLELLARYRIQPVAAH